MADMDIDMDIDIGGGPDEDVIEPDSAPIEAQTIPDTSQGPIDAMEGEVLFAKVNIRGLDTLSTSDVKQFAREHYPAHEPELIQWVDDTSANIVYPTADIGTEALLAFLAASIDASEINNIPDGQGAVAKALSTHPDISLRVRPAQTTDVKQSGARDASRFYLLNPDQDPREQRERQRRDAIRRKRRREEDRAMLPFDVNMYDDPPLDPSLDRPLSDLPRPRRRNSDLVDGGYHAKRARIAPRRGQDLFAGRLGGRDASDRLRDRSASPRKAHIDGDGRYGFAEDAAGQRMRQRSFSPTATFSIRGAAARGDSQPRDLFAAQTPHSTTLFGERIELFPNNTSPIRDRELFPGRKGSTSSQQHRRTDAMDADDSLVPSPLPSGRVSQRTLADRISKPETRSIADRIAKAGGPLEARISRSSAHMDQENPGFQIRGAAQAKVKELFPEKTEDAGRRDLFERVKAPRRKAEDLFG